MNRNTVEFNGYDILISLHEKYKEESWMLTNEQILSRSKQLFSVNKFKNLKIKSYQGHYKFGLISGITFNEQGFFYFIGDFDNYTCLDINLLSLEKLYGFIKISDSKLFGNVLKFRFGKSSYRSIKLRKEEKHFFEEFFKKCEEAADFSFDKHKMDEENLEKEREIEKEKFISKLKYFIDNFDKDKNGEIDLINNDFNLLLSKYQKQVIEIDKNYIHQFVKISNYIKTKKGNLQIIFKSISETKSIEELNEMIGLLKNQIHSYELLVFHSINMIGALVSEDLITFYEIYESFDKLNMFNSNWENEVSEKLTNIGDQLDDLIYSIDKLEQNIVNELNHLNYTTKESFKDLNHTVTNQLKEVESSINTNNLLTAIQSYQIYKINKNTKGLR